ncbi:MAG: substrate-binding domain-containing protein [Bacteroidota bacterium]
MQTVKICGVPEHFNLPWHFAMEEGAFEARGIDLIWTDVPEGTGKMVHLLGSGEMDLAIILTEGIVKSISDGNPSRIVQSYVESPLLWGIHVDGKSSISRVDELKGKKVAISRFGSGSHLMAFVHAQNNGWNTSTLQFEVVHHLEGAVGALQTAKADYFMWEHFTTKPLVDRGTFKFLGDCPTPWPCFVIAGNLQFLTTNTTLVNHILEVINNYTSEFKSIPSIDRTFANRYQQQLMDIRKWLSSTFWSQEQLSVEIVARVIEKMDSLDLLGSEKNSSAHLWENP